MSTRAQSAERLTEQMHAVLDGTASTEQQAALHAELAANPEAADEFASWQTMFRTLAGMPMAHPPEGLVASISAALPATERVPPETFSKPNQLFVAPSVIGSGQTKSIWMPSGFKASTTREFGQMNANRKIWAGGAVAAVALGVAFFATQYPAKPENVTGTIAPAERYRAPQAGAESVKLGDQTTAPVTQVGTDAASPQAAKTDAQMMADKTSAQMTADKTSAQMMADKTSAQMMADKTSAQMMADKTSAQMMADKTSAQMMADKSNAQMMADRAAIADRSAAAERANASMKAQKTDAGLHSADKAATN
jgi:anti-sigma factor RsiW